jgi:uncharacterized protein (DUF302 family)
LLADLSLLTLAELRRLESTLSSSGDDSNNRYYWQHLSITFSIHLLAVASSEPAVQKDEGIVTIPSTHDIDQTVNRLETILESKGVKLFALVDHSGEAAKVGLKMPRTKLLIFGNPKAGTPLMLAAPSIALDPPLKILVAQDSQGKVWISYNSPEYLKERYGLPRDLLPNIAVVEKLAAEAGE